MQRRLRDSLPVWLKVNALLLQQRPLAVNCGATAPRAVEPADAPISSNHTMSRNLISGRAPRIRCEWVPPHALAHRSRTAACHSRKLAVRGDAAGRDAADQGKDRLLERSQSHGGGSKKKYFGASKEEDRQAAWRGAVERPTGGPSAPGRRCWRLGRKRPSPRVRRRFQTRGPLRYAPSPTRIWRAMKYKVLLRKRGGARARAARRELFLETRPFGGSCFLCLSIMLHDTTHAVVGAGS